MIESIYQFETVAEYLDAIYKEKKKNRPRFSLRQFASFLGFSESGALSKVLKRKRSISLPTVQRVAQKLSLDYNQTLYLHQLAWLDEAPDEIKKPTLQHLRSLLAKRTFLGSSDLPADHRLLAEHTSLPLLECLRLKSPFNQVESLKQSWRATPSLPNFEDAFQKLESAGLVQKEDEKWTPVSSDAFVYVPHVTSSVVQHYHFSWLQSAMHALSTVPKDERYFQGTAVAIPARAFERISNLLNDLHQEVLDLGEDEAEQVMYLGTYLLPITAKNHHEGGPVANA